VTRVLVTGGTGVLGREVVSRLLENGYTVRVMSRSPRRGALSNVEWAQADMMTGTGLAEAMDGVNAIVHAATDSRNMAKTDVEMTRLLLEKAKAAEVGYFLYISIVGIENVPFAFYQIKLACESLVRDSGIPSASLRLTQFHDLSTCCCTCLRSCRLGCCRWIGNRSRLMLVMQPIRWCAWWARGRLGFCPTWRGRKC
jgi:uncharacterized protein YbjT (DUF2867 family)